MVPSVYIDIDVDTDRYTHIDVTWLLLQIGGPLKRGLGPFQMSLQVRTR